jgi:hypothetical protein
MKGIIMHYLMLVTLAMPSEATSFDARTCVESRVIDDRSFCGEGGRFSVPVCDWFVIGGRWSGHLRETLMGDAYRETLLDRFPQFRGYYSPDQVKECAEELDIHWREFGGSGPSSLNRDAYQGLGYDDDAMPVDRTLYKSLLARYHGEAIHQEKGVHCQFFDLDDEEVDESFIGRKWIAVVDYHS